MYFKIWLTSAHSCSTIFSVYSQFYNSVYIVIKPLAVSVDRSPVKFASWQIRGPFHAKSVTKKLQLGSALSWAYFLITWRYDPIAANSHEIQNYFVTISPIMNYCFYLPRSVDVIGLWRCGIFDDPLRIFKTFRRKGKQRRRIVLAGQITKRYKFLRQAVFHKEQAQKVY